MGVRRTRGELLDSQRMHLANAIGRQHALLLYLCANYATDVSLERLIELRNQAAGRFDTPATLDGDPVWEDEAVGMVEFARARDEGWVVGEGNRWTSALSTRADILELARTPGFYDEFERGYEIAYADLHPSLAESAATTIAKLIGAILVELVLAELVVGAIVGGTVAARAMVRGGRLGPLTVRTSAQRIIDSVRALFTRNARVWRYGNVEIRLTDQLIRQARQLVRDLQAMGKEVVVNIGGGTQARTGQIVLDPLTSDAPRAGITIADHVRAPGEFIGDLFQPGSLDRAVSYNIEPGHINWTETAQGLRRALRSGGKAEIFPFGAGGVNELEASFRAAGFRVETTPGISGPSGVIAINP